MQSSNVRLARLVVACSLALGFANANAASITYALDQSNTTPPFADGANPPYATVTIEDAIFGGDNNAIKFTVTPNLSLLTPGSNFGIDGFAFNLAAGAPTIADANIVGPAGWSGNVAPPPNQYDGFGRFVGAIDGTGSNRQSPLQFYVTGVVGDTIASYAAPSSGNAGQGNAWFSAHIAGFVVSGNPGVTSAYFGGGNTLSPPPVVNPVPVPAAVWLLGSALGATGIFGRRRSA